MSKNVYVQVFLDNRLYSELLLTKNEKKIPVKNDSQMVEYFLKQYLQMQGQQAITIYSMQQQINKHKEVEQQLTDQLQFLKGELQKEKHKKIKKVIE